MQFVLYTTVHEKLDIMQLKTLAEEFKHGKYSLDVRRTVPPQFNTLKLVPL